MNHKKVLTISIIVATLAVLPVLYFLTSYNQENTDVVSKNTETHAQESKVTQQVIETELTDSVDEVMMPEIVFVPDDASIPKKETQNASLNITEFTKGTKSMTQIRPIVQRDELGGYINPRLSPDGLQVMLTRPGFQGIYVVDIFGKNQPRLIADVNSYTAKWTTDGRIIVTVNDDEVRLYNLDGTIEYTEPKTSEENLAYSKDDVIFVASQPGEAAVPLTDNSDRYIAPQLSPAEDNVAYIGLHTGLYVSPTDGSSEPIFLGEGYNVSWSNDGQSIVFDRPTDDGHYVVESDIYHYDLQSGELTNLTENSDLVGQFPSIGPDGESIAFESDGSIYSGIID